MKTVFICVIVAVVVIICMTCIFAVIYNRKIRELTKEGKTPDDRKGDAGGEQEKSIYARMVPAELLPILDVKDTADISFEKQNEVELVNMFIDCVGVSEMIHGMKTKEIFQFINRFLNLAVPKVTENGGIIESFQKCGLVAVYGEDYEQAVVSAISVCETAAELAVKMPQYRNITVGIHYENVFVGVVGNKERLSILALSGEASGFSSWLHQMAKRYYSHILVTERYLVMVEDYKRKFNLRLLGYVYMEKTGSMEKIYDVFDGDDNDMRNRKRQTRMVFESGIQLYTEQKFEEARQHFIEVLKSDRYDLAAKEYVYRCEEYIREKPANPVVYIERY